MSTSAFPNLSQGEQIFKDLVWDPMILAGENWLEAEVTFLDLPVIKQMDEAIIHQITDAIFSQFCLLVDTAALSLKNSEMQTAYAAASENLVIVAAENGVSSDAYQKALSKERSALIAIGHITSR